MKDRPRSSNMLYDDEAASQLTETQTEIPDDENDNVHEEIDGLSDKVDYNEEVSQGSEIPSTSKEMNITRKLSQQQNNERDAPKMKKLTAKDSPLEFLKEQARKREERSKARQGQRDMLLLSSHNSLKLFFDSMYEATNILPLQQQRQVRRAIFNAVSAAEEAAENQSIGCSTPRACSITDSGEDTSNLLASYVPQANAMVTADNENYQGCMETGDNGYQPNYIAPTVNEHQANEMVNTDDDYEMLNVLKKFP